MTKTGFWEWLEGRRVYLDGATGSNLIKSGMPGGVCPEAWILEHKEVLVSLQKAYVEAGTEILYAPTFTANRIKLKEYGLENRLREINEGLVSLSKEAAGNRALVAADISMTGEQLSPMGKLDFEELVDIYKEQIRYVAQAGVDLLAVETMMSLQECRAALLAAKEVCNLPVMVTMTFEADGRSLLGTDAKTAAVVLESLGAAAVGANCSTGPEEMAGIINDMAEVVDIPLIAKPNAGLPGVDKQGRTVYDMEAEEFGEKMRLLAEAGACILGGCCGTTPAHILALTKSVRDIPFKKREKPKARYLASERKVLSFGLQDPLILVGERINPTGKKALQAELREGNTDRALRFAEEQEEKGAGILDINVGMSGIEEKAMMLRLIEEVSGVTSLPLSIDSSHVEVIEAALRRYPGRALINSISYEKEKFEKLLPVAAKYGAMFILLPLSDKGLPESMEEKREIIETICDRAYALGMDFTDIVVDGLVTTAGANPKAALETLETIRYCKEKGLATICGLSNISFGLPERRFVNAAFLTMAVKEGLTMAIANPSQELLVDSAYAASLLANRSRADICYIERMSQKQAKAESEKTGTEKTAQADAGPETQKAGILKSLQEAVLKGNKKNSITYTKEALQSGILPKALLDDTLLPAINEVGELFEKGIYFLPQLIAGAEAMKASIEYLEPLLIKDSNAEDMPVIVIATVKGDIHDIGKNLVALMLQNYGFQVVDLGKDVPREVIVETARKRGAKVIALSALMTTTMQEMRRVIACVKENGLDVKIIVGGAVITQEYADEIGADGYSKDAAEAVKLTKRLLEME